MSAPIKSVIVIGASGNIGRAATSALVAAGFTVSALTRETSTATFPENIIVHKTDYSTPSLLNAFKDQDAIVSTISATSSLQQISIIDAAITSGVKRFLPSEFGIDSAHARAEEVLPVIKGKQAVIEHLNANKDSGLSWTAIVTGAIFDWSFQYPGLMGWNLPARKATIFDGGNTEYEATNLHQIGHAIVAILQPANLEATANQFVYINSFATTQNRVLAGFEKLVGQKFEIEKGSVQELAKMGLEAAKRDGGVAGVMELIVAVLYGNGGLNNYSKTKGLWNERLALPVEDLDETLARIVAEYGGVGK